MYRLRLTEEGVMLQVHKSLKVGEREREAVMSMRVQAPLLRKGGYS